MGTLGAVLLIIKVRYRLRVGKLGWVVIFYGVWTYLSILWAEDSAFCSRKLVVFGMYALASLGISKQWSIQTLIQWIFMSSFSFLLVGIVSELVHETFSPFSHGYRFGGTLHPNSQGFNCGILFLSGIALMSDTIRYRAQVRGVMAVSLIFLLMTGSRTALASTLIASGIFVSINWSKMISLVIGYLSILGAFGSFVFGVPDIVIKTVLLGRIDHSVGTFTGRVPIWAECLDQLGKKYLCGVGYGSFWSPERIIEISRQQDWLIKGGSHSAYIEIVLGIGLIGLLLYFTILFGSIIKSFHIFSKEGNVGYVFAACFLILGLLHGILEAIVILPTHSYFLTIILFMMLGFQYHSDEVRNGM
jgi:O-antigen ligase